MMQASPTQDNPHGSPNGHILVDHEQAPGRSSKFELQPVYCIGSNTVWAYELLYRGARPVNWVEVDTAVVRFLWHSDASLPRFLVNISNETLLALPSEDFARADRHGKVIFELSESFTDELVYKKIARKAREVAGLGVKLALDDFGAGLDGLRRLYGHGEICVVKVDMEFLHMCMWNKSACETLVFLLRQWKDNQITTIAEGIESEVVMNFAKEIGFDMVQGWFVDQLAATLARSLPAVRDGVRGPFLRPLCCDAS
jgi:EAL domain-containing protein (putative c-di-GMP-specific phosphodiesterase class I)